MTTGEISKGEIGALIEDLDHFQDIVYQLENLTENSSSVLHGMIDIDAMGVAGHHWGAFAAMHSYLLTPQIRACVMLGACTEAQNFYIWGVLGPMIENSSVMLQVGLLEAENRARSITAYQSFTYHRDANTTVCRFDLPQSDENGPFAWDLVVSFLFYHLRNEVGYETFLYGDDAKDRTLKGYHLLSFHRGFTDSWTYEEPDFTIHVPDHVYMDHDVVVNVTWVGMVALDDPNLSHEWFIGDETTPYITSKTSPNMTIQFTEPGSAIPVRYTYKLNRFEFSSEVEFVLVRNLWPVAEAGPNITVYQEEPLELNASLSRDTPSDIDTLVYNWTFGGKQTPWSEDPTTTIEDTSRVGNFSAYLLVKDRHGKFTRDSVTVHIINKPPEVRLTVEATTYDEDEPVQFTWVGNDSDSHISSLQYRWDFGDGTVTDWSP
ncbi:MAG: hypothetical protein GWN97_07030, partial [Thermoplasmata archaeon]|nr:hypothetical protein [Thermoplasmata archaeon]